MEAKCCFEEGKYSGSLARWYPQLVEFKLSHQPVEAFIQGSDIRQKSTDRRIELVIPKEEPKWWPRLLKESTKVPWIKINFDKWSDNKEEKEGEEEDGVDKLFQKIYRDADDDVRKAMAKSFSESCGTVLSTNWRQVGAKKTEVKPPDGMEFKKYGE